MTRPIRFSRLQTQGKPRRDRGVSPQEAGVSGVSPQRTSGKKEKGTERELERGLELGRVSLLVMTSQLYSSPRR